MSSAIPPPRWHPGPLGHPKSLLPGAGPGCSQDQDRAGSATHFRWDPAVVLLLQPTAGQALKPTRGSLALCRQRFWFRFSTRDRLLCRSSSSSRSPVRRASLPLTETAPLL